MNLRPPHSDYFRARRRRLLRAVCNETGKQRSGVRAVERILRRFDARGPQW